MSWKTEMHVHSSDVSKCATVSAETIVNRYLADDYSTVVLTNHLNFETYKKFGVESWDEKIRLYMYGFEHMCEEAAGRLNILLGMELRFFDDNNDYLIYGMTEDFMRSSSTDFLHMNLKTFAPLAREQGMLVIQAHPFRNEMTVKKPELLDGVEVYNGHIGHDSRNDIANLWADKFGLIKTSGTDFHHDKHVISGGIETENEIKTNADLLAVIKSGAYKLIRGGAVPY